MRVGGDLHLSMGLQSEYVCAETRTEKRAGDASKTEAIERCILILRGCRKILDVD